MAFAALSQCGTSTAAAARSVRRARSLNARARPVSAVATEVAPARVFTNEEWELATKEAVKLAAAYAAAAASAAPEASTTTAPPPGRVFTDAEWAKAFQLASSQNPLLYNSIAATGEAPVALTEAADSAYPTFPAPPPGQAFSNEEWEYAFAQAAKGLEAAVAEAPTSGFPAPPPGRVFSDEEWTAAMKRATSGVVEDVEELVPLAFNEVMAFAGPGPQTINGRLAMFGFVTALASELGSAKSVAAQYAEASGGVLVVVVLLSIASLVPLLKGSRAKALGPLKPEVEKLNGQAAMVGFASLVAIEGLKGSALF